MWGGPRGRRALSRGDSPGVGNRIGGSDHRFDDLVVEQGEGRKMLEKEISRTLLERKGMDIQKLFYYRGARHNGGKGLSSFRKEGGEKDKKAEGRRSRRHYI